MFRRSLSVAVLVGCRLVALGSDARAESDPAGAHIVPLAAPTLEPADDSNAARPASGVPTDLQVAADKSPLAAVAFEIIPGAGSLYADDVPGAVTTWALVAGGLAMSIYGFSQISFPDTDTSETRHSSPLAMPLLLSGLGLAVYGRFHGFVSAYHATERYNAALRSRRGVSLSSLSLTPVLSTDNRGLLLLGGRF
jgi:hypothetical protein